LGVWKGPIGMLCAEGMEWKRPGRALVVCSACSPKDVFWLKCPKVGGVGQKWEFRAVAWGC
jgi:hypothetical protein